MTHHVDISWNESFTGSTQKRIARFEGNRLLLSTPQSLDPIFMPQHLFVCDERGALLVHDLYDLDDMERLQTDLSARLSRPVVFSRYNSTGAGDDLALHYRDPAVVKAVGDYYAGDVALFDYCPSGRLTVPRASDRPPSV